MTTTIVFECDGSDKDREQVGRIVLAICASSLHLVSVETITEPELVDGG